MKIVKRAVGVVFLGLFLLGTGLDKLLVVPFYLLAGWFFFLKRTLPGVAFNLGGFALALLCSGIVLFGIHSFGSWIFQRNSDEPSEFSARKWQWRWTSGIFLSACLLFVSAIASTGVFHQVGWLLSSNEPFFTHRAHRVMLISDLKQIAIGLTMAAEDHGWKPVETVSAWNTGNYIKLRRPAVEDWHILFLEDEKEKFACVIFHRDPQTRAKIFGFALIADATYVVLPKDQLPQTLARFGIKTVAKMD